MHFLAIKPLFISCFKVILLPTASPFGVLKVGINGMYDNLAAYLDILNNRYSTGNPNANLLNGSEQTFKDPIGLDFSEASAKYWSIHLMNGFEKKIKTDGYVSFYLWSEGGNTFTEFVRLTLGSITFLKDGKTSFTYKLEDIQKIYRKENLLHIQHKNFEKTLFFMRKGNEDIIPLGELSNQGYFFMAMERILGYALV